MFYSKSLITKGGPLQVVWLAAHSERRIRRQQLQSTSIPETVDCILLPHTALPDGPLSGTSRAALGLPSHGHDTGTVMPLALRLSGQLLLGVVRVYKDQLSYLAQDVEGALCNLQLGGAHIQAVLLPQPSTAADNTAQGEAEGSTDAPLPSGAGGVRNVKARIAGRLQHQSDMEELIAALGSMDEEEAFMDVGGEGGTLADWTEIGRDRSNSQPGTLLRKMASVGLTAGTSALATPLPILRGASQDFDVLTSGGSSHVLVRAGGRVERAPVEQEVFDTWDGDEALPLDLDNSDVWLLSQPQPAHSTETPAEQHTSSGAAAAAVPRPVASEERHMQRTGDGDEEHAAGDDVMDSEAGGLPAVGEDRRDGDGVGGITTAVTIEQPTDGQPRPAGASAKGQVVGRAASAAMLSAAQGAVGKPQFDTLGMTVYKGLQLGVLMEASGGSGHGINTTTLPSAEVRSLLEDRSSLLSADRAHVQAAAVAVRLHGPDHRLQGPSRAQTQDQGLLLRSILLHGGMGQHSCLSTATAPPQHSAAAQQQELRLHQQLQPYLSWHPLRSAVVHTAGCGTSTGSHHRAQLKAKRHTDGTKPQLLLLTQQMAPYLSVSASAACESPRGGHSPRLGSSAAARLADLSVASSHMDDRSAAALLQCVPGLHTPVTSALHAAPSAQMHTPASSKRNKLHAAAPPTQRKLQSAAAVNGVAVAVEPVAQQGSISAVPDASDADMGDPGPADGETHDHGTDLGGVGQCEEVAPEDHAVAAGSGGLSALGDGVMEEQFAVEEEEEDGAGVGLDDDEHGEGGYVLTAGRGGGADAQPVVSDGFIARTRRLLVQLQQLVHSEAGDVPTPQALGQKFSVSQQVIPQLTQSTQTAPSAKTKAPSTPSQSAQPSRMDSARMFVDLLVLQNRSYIRLSQRAAYEDLEFAPRSKLYHAVAQATQPPDVGPATMQTPSKGSAQVAPQTPLRTPAPRNTPSTCRETAQHALQHSAPHSQRKRPRLVE